MNAKPKPRRGERTSKAQANKLMSQAMNAKVQKPKANKTGKRPNYK